MLNPAQIPTTGRKTAFQARQLGYESVVDFAASLPEGATIVDVGAGLSRLGHEVGNYRPDVHWINIDPCYRDEEIAAAAQEGLPDNVRLLSEDIVQGSALLAG